MCEWSIQFDSRSNPKGPGFESQSYQFFYIGFFRIIVCKLINLNENQDIKYLSIENVLIFIK
jgi:hypothetical protein